MTALLNRLGWTHFWMRSHLWLFRELFLLLGEPTVHLLLNTPCCGLSSEPTLVVLREPPPQGSQFSYRYEKVTYLSPSYFCELAVVFGGHMIYPQFRKGCYNDGPFSTFQLAGHTFFSLQLPITEITEKHTSQSRCGHPGIFSWVRHEGDRKRFNLLWPTTRMCEAFNSVPSMTTVKII